MSSEPLAANEDIISQATPEDVAYWLLVMTLRDAGYLVWPKRWRGAHTHLELPDGTHLSLSTFLALQRYACLRDHKCGTCNARLPRRSGARGPRVDRRYCSNACRQAAYRRRVDGDLFVKKAAA